MLGINQKATAKTRAFFWHVDSIVKLRGLMDYRQIEARLRQTTDVDNLTFFGGNVLILIEEARAVIPELLFFMRKGPLPIDFGIV